MGRGKDPAPKPKLKRKPGRVDRKVIIEYSSDEEFDEDNPQPVVGTGVPKRIVPYACDNYGVVQDFLY